MSAIACGGVFRSIGRWKGSPPLFPSPRKGEGVRFRCAARVLSLWGGLSRWLSLLRFLAEPFHPNPQASEILRRQTVFQHNEMMVAGVPGRLDLQDGDEGQDKPVGNPVDLIPGIVPADFQFAVGLAAQGGFRSGAGIHEQACGKQQRAGDPRRDGQIGQPQGQAGGEMEGRHGQA